MTSLEQFIQTERSLQFLKQNTIFNLFQEVSQIQSYIRTIRIQIGKNNWDLETQRKYVMSICLPA